jgi:hypothetical protein
MMETRKVGRPRKIRSDSVNAEIRVGYDLQASAAHLVWRSLIPAANNKTEREVELCVFEATLSTRRAQDWTPIHMMLVARLAGHLAQQIQDEDTLKRSGSLIRSPKNEKHFINNPLLNVVATRQAIISQLMRQLGVSTPAIDMVVMSNAAQTEKSMTNANAFSLLAN